MLYSLCRIPNFKSGKKFEIILFLKTADIAHIYHSIKFQYKIFNEWNLRNFKNIGLIELLYIS